MKIERLPPPAKKKTYPETDIDDSESIPEDRKTKIGKKKSRRFRNSREVLQPLPEQIVVALLFSDSSVSLWAKVAKPCESPASGSNY